MKFKKLISMAVTAAMIFALAAPAFAFGGGGSTTPSAGGSSSSASATGGQVAVDSSVQEPTIKVTVPSSGAVILNPYRMIFKVSGNDHTEVFYSAPIICKNESDCTVDVSASATAVIGGGIKLVDAANSVQTPTEPGDKNVFLEMKSGTFAASDSTDFASEKTELKFTFEQANKGYGYGAKGDGITIEDKYLSLPYSEDPTYFGFILNGDANQNTSVVWTASDTIAVTIVLTFTPKAIDRST